MSDELKAQDCELEYWNQQAEDYAQVQIPCEDLRAIINRAWEAPAFNSALTAAEAERNRAQLACQQIAERLTASEARAEAAETRVKAAQGEADMIRACCDMFERAINEGDPKAELLIRVQEIREAATRTLKGTPDGR